MRTVRAAFAVTVLIAFRSSPSGRVIAEPSSSRVPCVAWQKVPAPHGSSESVTQIDGVSSSDMWGSVDAGVSPHRARMLHWDGTAWTDGPIDPVDASLESVDILSATDGWAVGGNDLASHTFHWDGVNWSEVPSPPGVLRGVSGTGSTDVWAVGSDILHWDGDMWTPVPHPSHPGEILQSVLALAPDDAWTVGEASQDPIIQHWDGSAWTDVPLPGGPPIDFLYSISGSGPDNIWAVGNHEGGALVVVWDGSSWFQPNRIPYPVTSTLSSVSVLAPDDVWVAGPEQGGGPPVAAHWNGSRWTFTPVEKENGWFLTIKAFSPEEVWAAGNSVADDNLVERYVGCP